MNEKEKRYGEFWLNGKHSKAKPLKYEIDGNGCYNVIGRKLDARGRCYLRYKGKLEIAHRAVYMFVYGSIPDNLVVRHKCDNGGCINPKHLELGTKADNNRDKIERGRVRVNTIKYVEPDIKIPLDANKRTLDIKINKNTDCWEVVNRVPNQNGYFMVGYKNKQMLAHRFMYQREYGEIPHGMVVRHYVCDNPACCNPKHLKIGTHLDNMRDMKVKGREPKGEDHGLAKLTSKDVEFIFLSELPNNELAKMFNVGTSAISAIKLKKAWNHVTNRYYKFPLSKNDIINMYLSPMDAEHLAKEYFCSVDFADKVKKGIYYSELTKRFG